MYCYRSVHITIQYVTKPPCGVLTTMQASKTTTIRVIEAKKKLIDPSIVTPEELSIVLDAVKIITPQLTYLGSVLNDFIVMAHILQGPLANVLIGREFLHLMDAVLVRELLINPAVRPIIYQASNSGKTTKGIYTRSNSCKQAFDEFGNSIAISAEEPMLIKGFAIDLDDAGSIIDYAGYENNLGIDVCAESGAFSTAVYASAGPVRPPEYEITENKNNEFHQLLR